MLIKMQETKGNIQIMNKEEIEDIYKDDNTLLTFLLSNSSYIEGGNDNE